MMLAEAKHAVICTCVKFLLAAALQYCANILAVCEAVTDLTYINMVVGSQNPCRQTSKANISYINVPHTNQDCRAVLLALQRMTDGNPVDGRDTSTLLVYPDQTSSFTQPLLSFLVRRPSAFNRNLAPLA
jgi:hypothetical protein